ncbi:HAD family hydrolase [Candidatus Nanohalococcus occultus]|uniref:HAD family hydrolase n=1 Tax=Candidatus Nanohalococcus occultus TaxID=2978047 RepID=UPI0039E0A324
MTKIPVFDIGDTLFPTVKIYRQAVAQEVGEDCEVGNFNIFDPDSSEQYFEKKGIDVDGEKIRDAYIAKVESYMYEQGVLEMLKKCSEEFGAIGIISDNWSYARKIYAEMFEDYGIEFEGMIVSEEVGVKKPDRKIFEAFLAEREKDAEKFVYFGNHGVRDPAAEKTGMDFVFTTEYFNFDTSYEGRKIPELSFENVRKEVEK